MATAAELITTVQEIYGDTREVSFTRAMALKWLSEGQKRIAKDTGSVTIVTTFNITTVGTAYDGHVLPTSPAFIKEAAVEWKGVPTRRIAREDINQFAVKLGETTTDEPTHHFYFQERLWVWPYPATANALSPLKLWYYAMPNDIATEGTALLIPPVLHDELIDFVLMRARERNEDPEQAQRSKQSFDDKMAQARDIINNPSEQSYPVVRDDPGDWY